VTGLINEPGSQHFSSGDADAADVWARLPQRLGGASALAAAAGLVALATLTGTGLGHWLPQHSVALVYLLVVVLAAIGLGTWSGLATAFFAFLAYNFYFIPPVYTFTIADPKELFALLVFFAVAVVTGSLAGRMREAADSARQRATALHSLNEFAGRLSASRSIPAILEALAAQCATTIHGDVVVLRAGDDNPELLAAVPADARLEPVDMQAAQRAMRSGEIKFASAQGWPGARYEFRPLKIAEETAVVIGLAPGNGRRMVAGDDEATLLTLIRHSSIAIERTTLEAAGAVARDVAERERIRSALLSSLSHDLKTPLASILGAATSLRELGRDMPAETQADLLAAIEEEARRLTQFVANLLDLTRLDTEKPDLKHEWLDVTDAAQTAVARAKRLFAGSQITLTAPPGSPLVRGDAMLFEHLVFNLIDNAVKFAGVSLPVIVSVASESDAVTLTVIDQGRGIPPDKLKQVFEKFYRVRDGDRDIQGTGLGLTICKRVVEGMDGTIHAESPVTDGKGTRMVVQLPIAVMASNVSHEYSEPAQ
jgi:two-component system, OmpR family, sensor histidine kinase KdpD